MRQAKQTPDAESRPAAQARKDISQTTPTADYQAFVDRSPRMLAQRRSIDHLSAKGTDTPAALSFASNRGAPLQRFKDADSDVADVTPEQIASASLEKLQEWLAREAPEVDSWEDLDIGGVPNEAEKQLIEARIEALGAAARRESARQRRLIDLGVNEAELQLFETTTTENKLIREAAAHMKVNGWDIQTLLAQIAGAARDVREIAISVCAKGEVTSSEAVVKLAVDWDRFNQRDGIVVTDLIELINHKAVIAKGGTYSEPELTGTQNKAFTFYANGKTRFRIDPEWHVHTTWRDGAAKPGFKRKSDKGNTGPGTRRDATKSETEAMEKAGFV